MSEAVIMNRTGIGVGMCVRDVERGSTGIVTDVHMSCPEGRAWQLGQQPPLPDEATELGHVWFSVLCHGGGSVAIPACWTERVAPFAVDNSWVSEYWPQGQPMEAVR